MSQQLELLTENPSQWTAVIRVTPEIQKKQIKPFVALALKELAGEADARLARLVHAEQYAAVRALVAHLARLRSATMQPWSLQCVTNFVESLRFPAECVSELVALLCTEQVYTHLPTHRRTKPALTGLQWKIDLSLSQSQLEARGRGEVRAHTHVLLWVALSNGTTHTYRLPLYKFHQLRWVVASALKAMLVMERHHAMRRD